MQGFAANLEADLASVFFGEFAEEIALPNQSDAPQVIAAIFESNVESIDDAGTLVMVANAVTVMRGKLKRNLSFRRNGKRWVVGKLLDRSPDNYVETWEVTGVGTTL